MENKKFWLKGLLAGIIVYVLFLLVYIGYAKEVAAYFLPTVALYILPTIPIGLFIGWLYGKMPKTAVFLSIIILVLLVGLKVFIYRNTFGINQPNNNHRTELENLIKNGKRVPCGPNDPPGAICF